MNDETRERFVNATVRLPEKGGQGVVVPNGLILTAAHCIGWSSEGEMALGEYYLETIECARRQIRVSVLAVEPVLDIAVLGPPDNQALADDAKAYDETLELVAPVEICTEDFALFRGIPAAVYTHKGMWIDATAQQCSDGAPRLCIETPQQIEGGTSGGPIVDERGRLLGVVSNASIGQGSTGTFPRPHLALPVWIVKRIVEAADQARDADD